MKTKNLILTLALLTIIFVGCVKEINVKLPYTNQKLVVNSLINSGEGVVADVSFTRPTKDTLAPLYIENAFVVLSREEKAFDTLIYNSFTNKYEGDRKPNLPARYYKISVKAPGYENTAYGTTEIPTHNSFVSAVFTPNAGVDDQGTPYGIITLKIKDRKDNPDYYNLKIDYFHTTSNTYRSLAIESNNPALDVKNNKQSDASILFGDKLFDGNEYEIKIITPFRSGPKFRVSLLTIGEEYGKYLASVERSNQGTIPFFFEYEPGIVYSNINGGLGVFAGAYKHIELLQ